MKFKDSITLSEQLINQLPEKLEKGSIILSLTEGSLMTALHVGARIHGWVYPLITAPITATDNPDRNLGIILQNGMFCSADYEAESPEVIAALHEQKTAALNSINAKVAVLGLSLDLRTLRGRTVILVADSLTESNIMLAACRLGHSAQAKDVYTLIGNASTAVSDLARSYSKHSVILDVVNTVDFNPFTQFQFVPNSSLQERLEFMKNIKTYWI